MNYEDLKILDELREKGSITEEEYQREKEKILNNTSIGSGKRPLFGMTENTYIMLMHLSQFAGVIVPCAGFIVPIIMWIANKDINVNVDLHGKNILNFMISYVIYAAVAAITIIGIPIAIIIGLLYVILVIIATVKAYNGEYWKYPLTIQFIK
ncbi:MAG TPA: DUF4870 domain-containing protein [Fermentimonas caenicola]|jgi:uncharacterized Tic20 family protein|uniref:SHOCT domain-containing protein n=1 Tax=Fermentimonas caenicola TaxID=1562970 RepID=A0A098C0T6_9BACT|nr:MULTISPECIES: DUF4870 domain-containing protein [Lascolabacillus]MBP6175199.1 DUF4870 domain-containing protein [Fermentimonas sp.]MDI9626401.1 DUF4870 domain-containing protein [Bacteroidota bacterium]TAH61989.1 MAG: DUF4870 domain-containing protein [Fermentimonas caenicola]MBP6195972.1 DUF4870 domain-containing protein [Fermentimonas sp.]MBP7104538.1 DUF4870 domain-containing protein [Fermentimonas sp.]